MIKIVLNTTEEPDVLAVSKHLTKIIEPGVICRWVSWQEYGEHLYDKVDTLLVHSVGVNQEIELVMKKVSFCEKNIILILHGDDILHLINDDIYLIDDDGLSRL